MKSFSSIRKLAHLVIAAFCIASLAQAEPTIGNDSGFSDEAIAKLKVALAYLEKNDAARANHLPSDFTVAQLKDEVPTLYKTRDGQNKVTFLNTRSAVLLDMARSLLWRKNKSAMRKSYTLIYNHLPKKFRKNLLKPKQLKLLSTKETRDVLNKFARFMDKQFLKIVSTLDPVVFNVAIANPIDSCSAEDGYAYFGSSSELSDRCSVNEYDPNGLFLQMDFPLRDDQTCIRDQGRRGTCTAHAVAAAIESRVLVDGGPPQDISEQDIYYRSEVYADSTVSIFEMQNYGSALHIALDQYVSRGFGIYYENQWGYNRSIFMGAMVHNNQTGLFSHPNSCDGYSGQSCSDFSFQEDAQAILYGVPEPQDPPTTGESSLYRITTHSELPGIGSGTLGADFSLQTAVILLSLEVPVIASLDITNSFSSTGSGYVRSQPNDPVRGGHSILLIGFVPNSELPSTVTPATEDGYFIVKNSWGTDAGDCGFYYLDYRYIKEHLYYLDIITIQ